MEPIRIRKDGVPIEVLRFCVGGNRIDPIVNHLGGPLGSSFFQEEHTDPSGRSANMGDIHPHPAQIIQSHLSDLPCWKLADKSSLLAKACQADRHIGFASGKADLKFPCLHKAAVACRIEPHHNFSKRNDLSHTVPPVIKKQFLSYKPAFFLILSRENRKMSIEYNCLLRLSPGKIIPCRVCFFAASLLRYTGQAGNTVIGICPPGKFFPYLS